MRRSNTRTPEQEARYRFLLAPISVYTHGSSLAWGGCRVSQTVPETGRRSVYYNPEDEEVLSTRHREE